MREADLARRVRSRRRPGPGAKRNDADRGTALAQEAAAAQPAGDRLDHPQFQGLGRFERRQYAGKPGASIDLPEPGGPTIRRLWPPDAAIFERALRALLALDVAQIEPGGARRRELRLGRRQELGPLEMVDDREEVRRRDDLNLTRPGCFAPAIGGADDAAALRGGGERGEEHPGDAGQRAVERHLAKAV